MKLVEIHFDWNPSIPGADSRGEGLLFPLKTQSIFRAAEGWSIEALSGDRFRLHRDGMPAPVVVGDGYTYVEDSPAPSVTHAAGRGDSNDRNTVDSEAAAGSQAKRSRRAKP